MSGQRVALNLDFGTESARALLVDVDSGREIATATSRYRHGVIDQALPGSGRKLPGDWALQHPSDYFTSLRKVDVHVLLEEKARAMTPGESGLIALDWLNGNRSVLNNADLSGAIVGLTLGTRPEEIYRALIEATAFGTRKIMENFEAHGVGVKEVCACGGLPDKNRLVMQIFADSTGREFGVAASQQATALGAAMFGAVAAGGANGGYDSIVEAAGKMAQMKEERFVPNPGHKRMYDDLYAEYSRLHDYFGGVANEVMAALKRMKGGAGAS